MWHVIFFASSPDTLSNVIVQFCMYYIEVFQLLEHVP